MNLQSAIKKYIPMTETMLYILLSLAREMHGYAIREHVLKITGGRLEIGAGTMYQSLARLQRDGLIAFQREQSRQKRYLITDLGKDVLNCETRRIRELYQNLEGLL
jgi:DNA-binding PadR family transcriptional regulator